MQQPDLLNCQLFHSEGEDQLEEAEVDEKIKARGQPKRIDTTQEIKRSGLHQGDLIGENTKQNQRITEMVNPNPKVP